ncbi:MAG: ferrous iron transport protein B [Saprospiraceae bacterium]
MTQATLQRIALLGNPNSGKSTVFNQLTGLRQKTGNFPGVTVDIKEGKIDFPSGKSIVLTDLPGTYSLHPTSSDERLVTSILCDPDSDYFPDAIVYVADVTHLEKHLLLLTQLIDLGFPVLLALNMTDVAEEKGMQVNADALSRKLQVPIVCVSGRTGQNIPLLIRELENLPEKSPQPFYRFREEESILSDAIVQNSRSKNPYRALLLGHHHAWLPFLSDESRATLAAIVETKGFNSLKAQVDETLDRYDRFTPIVQASIQTKPDAPDSRTDKLDAVLTHRIAGPLIFVVLMLLVFQAIYDWSTLPMDWIEGLFTQINATASEWLPDNWFRSLLTDGILAGLSGILVFVPQIFILFFLITILEELGYMARVVFMFDKFMRRFGMNGRSIVALISGGACAVPAIMSSRTIGNWQERLITVMVTPFISCSARLPVYAVLIGLAVPAKKVFGVFGLQSITFGAMYLLGVVAALLSGWAMKKWLGTREISYLAIELPVYRVPHWKNVWLTVWEKVLAFVWGAGKIILVISMVLWAMASFGPGDSMAAAEATAVQLAQERQLDSVATADLIAARQLESSYAGVLGKVIEPAIKPLGYDWKIGIALITSFAAREVFVGTMSTIYSIGSADNEMALRAKMKSAVWTDTGTPVYTLATALSLLVFYALAMQCMSTLAVVKKETGSWKWTLFQFAFMSALAYVAAWLVYVVFS